MTAEVTPQKNRSEYRDDELVAGILAGDAGCFETLHARYHPRIFRFALKRLRHVQEAEDVTQETFLQVYRCLERFEGRSSLLTWIFGIANNQVCRHFRRKSATLVAPEEVELWADSETAASVDRQVDANRILANCGRVLKERVSPAQREVFYLHYGENQSTRAIAERVGKSTQAIKISLFRTRRILGERAARDLDSVLH